MLKHFNIKIIGRVQGIGFRYASEQKAQELGIVGFVRNEPDGSVYIEAEGEEETLNKFVAWCQSGTRGAQIKEVKAVNAAIKNFRDFLIYY
ncbi:hypothetical protein A3G56_00670 [Candidatus Falkowbacteria bacterium RIFCSPLOWO2_12_FULL_45_10]|uniref:acylphosphatase n=3 Tax=Candidatus Falkowiibacteriota TaxID=1752728 RepID=A0A1F5RYP5_9BACT|nr:MAG: hypothetical protein A3G56_00670 [Candidatus Falkowbacteria bacterium RIFCSPLOWO2_12_FULL_45_10]OGF19557.1 MAG: hypothetical protein A3D54_03690 [Candidatus Falkowbacteria bacterium RIFCSPHIGHO2_02_FULL_45_15]OGF20215.1 MAG: hypothetical protein A3I35_04350 [Candidatus Falkowbacteria bacterium RIFCSPLOWO2_02_FULL_45_15]